MEFILYYIFLQSSDPYNFYMVKKGIQIMNDDNRQFIFIDNKNHLILEIV